MSPDLVLLDQLRAHGVHSASFDSAGRMTSVAFFDPLTLAQAEASRIVAGELADETPDALLARIKTIEQDLSLPELERAELAKRMTDELVYGASD